MKHQVILGPYKLFFYFTTNNNYLFFPFILYHFTLDLRHLIPGPYNDNIGQWESQTSQDPIQCFEGIPRPDCDMACNENPDCAAFEFGFQNPHRPLCCLLRECIETDGNSDVTCSQKLTGIFDKI